MGQTRHRTVAVAALMAALVAGCSGPGETNPATPSSTQPSESTPAATVTVTAPAQAADTSDPGQSDTTPGSPSGGPTIVRPTVSSGEQRITLAEAVKHASWHEGQYVPAGKAEGIPAIATEVSCYEDGRGTLLEMRFPDAVGKATLHANVAQGMDSESSNEKLEFTLQTDGRRADTKNIDFKGTAELIAPLSGVTVATIWVKPVAGSADYKCQDSATALITKLVLTY